MKEIILGIDPGTNLMGFGVLGVEGRQVECVDLGVIDLRKLSDTYEKLGRIYERVSETIEFYKPTCVAIEAPFFGKNVQSMLKLGRAQGVAIAAATSRGLSIHEYAPMKIKMALTGRGTASKEQVADMLQRILRLSEGEMSMKMDATDALAAAYCHYLQLGRPVIGGGIKSWKELARRQGKI